MQVWCRLPYIYQGAIQLLQLSLVWKHALDIVGHQTLLLGAIVTTPALIKVIAGLMFALNVILLLAVATRQFQPTAKKLKKVLARFSSHSISC